MPENNMSISVNGQSQVPPGFRFHPTEEELLQYYLRKKVSYEKIDLDVIRDVDLNKLEPWDIQEKCRIGSAPQNDWYFFSHKDKKYPTGTRTNRATAAGFWKATGRDKVIYSNPRRIGMRKTLVFYKGRAPHGQKSDWIMHEYRLLDDNVPDTNNISDATGEATQEEGWVVCRIFKKKNHHKTLDSNNNHIINVETRTQIPGSTSDEGTLEQILHYMGRTCKDEGFLMPIVDTAMKNGLQLHDRIFMKLPNLESPSQLCNYQQIQVQMLTDIIVDESSITNNNNNCHVNNAGIGTGTGTGTGDPIPPNSPYQSETASFNDWTSLDRLVASQLNGQSETSKQLACFNDSTMALCSPSYHDFQLQHQLRSSRPFHHLGTQDDNGEFDLWNFTRSSSSSADPLCHVSNTPV
ncbi:hypothetical protein CsSME_00013121 [Camellia sinensis var. sinensis]